MNLATRWNVIRYSLYTPVYDLVAGFFAPYRKQSIGQLQLKSGDKVLLVGAGTGLDLRYFPDNVQITATDITPAMLLLLKQRARKLGKQPEVLVMDGQQLPLPDGSFDAVVLHLILAVIPDPVACLQACERVLKPGGEIVIFDKFLAADQRTGWLRTVTGWFAKLLFSDINRQFEPIQANTGLSTVHNLPGAFGGIFRLIKLVKA